MLEELYERKSIPPFGEPYQSYKTIFRNNLDRTPPLKNWTRHDPLLGGTTNRTWKITVGKDKFRVLKVWNKNADKLGIERTCEVFNSTIAHRTGVGSEVLYHNMLSGVMVLDYLEGIVLDNDNLSNTIIMLSVIKSIKKLHHGTRFINDFDIFDLMDKFLKICKDNNYKLPESFFEHKKNIYYINKIRKELSLAKGPTVACHNDLMSNNIIATKDGYKFIDFEYSGNNDPCYELGHMWTEANLDIHKLDFIVREYFGYWDQRNIKKSRLYSIVSNYTWYLWGIIQSNIVNQVLNNYDYKKDYEVRYSKAKSQLNYNVLKNLLNL